MNLTKLASALPPLELVSAEQRARKREVDNALLVQALCERQPNPGVLAQLVRYITGELSREQAFSALYVGMS